VPAGRAVTKDRAMVDLYALADKAAARGRNRGPLGWMEPRDIPDRYAGTHH